MSKGSPYSIRSGNFVFDETFSTLDGALEFAKKISKAFSDVAVVLTEGAERIVRAFGDNGHIVWAKKCQCKGDSCGTCVLGYRRDYK